MCVGGSETVPWSSENLVEKVAPKFALKSLLAWRTRCWTVLLACPPKEARRPKDDPKDDTWRGGGRVSHVRREAVRERGRVGSSRALAGARRRQVGATVGRWREKGRQIKGAAAKGRTKGPRVRVRLVVAGGLPGACAPSPR